MVMHADNLWEYGILAILTPVKISWKRQTIASPCFRNKTNKNLKRCCLQYIKGIKYLGINQLKEIYELNKKFGNNKIILREIKEDIYINGGIIKL